MVLVFAESQQGQYKKSAFEAVYFGKQTANLLGVPCYALVLGTTAGADKLGTYGAEKVFQINNAGLDHLDSQVFAAVIGDAVQKLGATVLIMSHSSTGKSVFGRLAAKLDAGSVSGVNALPELVENGHLRVSKGVFSGKAVATYDIHSDIKLLSLMGNAIQPQEIGQPISPESLDIVVPEPNIKVIHVDRVKGSVPLPEAELVVSGGRGFKGPENWGILEELAQALGAATACSRPVADSDWRPHHEHVGQTGVAIRPNLYIAIGISGAIQHLAGVNNSKVIVVINKDPEAPFFKAADYGVVGDLFEVVPQLTQAIKAFKG